MLLYFKYLRNHIMSDNKIKISKEEFDKRVDIETASLIYFERMRKEEAILEAKKYVETKYIQNKK